MILFEDYLKKEGNEHAKLAFDVMSEDERNSVLNLINDYGTECVDEGISKPVCSLCGDPIEHPLCRSCEIKETLPTEEY